MNHPGVHDLTLDLHHLLIVPRGPPARQGLCEKRGITEEKGGITERRVSKTEVEREEKARVTGRVHSGSKMRKQGWSGRQGEGKEQEKGTTRV